MEDVLLFVEMLFFLGGFFSLAIESPDWELQLGVYALCLACFSMAAIFDTIRRHIFGEEI